MRTIKIIALALAAIGILLSVAVATFLAGLSGADMILERGKARPHNIFMPGEYEFASITSKDYDGDGRVDKLALQFNRKKLAEDVYLDRSLEYSPKTPNVYHGAITLKLTGGTDEITLVEEIPKSLAEDVSQLSFTPLADEIIDPDPKVSWTRGFNGEFEIKITLEQGKGIDDVKEDINTYAAEEGLKLCFDLSGKDRDDCFESVAKLSATPEVCDEIGDIDAHARCIGYIAANTRDKKLCESLDDHLKDECLYGYGVKTGDPKACDSMTEDVVDTGYRDACLGEIAVTKLDASLCEKLEDPYGRDICLLNIAKRNGDETLCRKMDSSTPLADYCRQLAAGVNLDLTGCLEIKNPGFRDVCMAELAAKFQSARQCEAIRDSQFRQDCLNAINAMQAGDSRECYNIQRQELRDLCFKKYAEKNQDEAECGEIQDSDLKSSCLAQLAVKKRDPQLCGRITAFDIRQACIAKLADLLQDDNLCQQIYLDYYRDLCYLNLALKLGKTGLCEKILDDVKRNKCLESAGEAAELPPVISEGLEDLHHTDYFSMNFCVSGLTISYKDGEYYSQNWGLKCVKGDASPINLSWDGTRFSASGTWKSQNSGRNVDWTQSIEGQVSEDGKHLLWAKSREERVETEVLNERKTYLEVNNIPLNDTRAFYDEIEYTGKIRGPQTQAHVGKYSAVDKNQWKDNPVNTHVTFEKVNFSDNNHQAWIKVLFKGKKPS